MAMKWHSELSRWRARLTGNLLSLFPQQRFKFAIALRDGRVVGGGPLPPLLKQ